MTNTKQSRASFWKDRFQGDLEDELDLRESILNNEYKIAYSPMYESYVSIESVIEDEIGEPIIFACPVGITSPIAFRMNELEAYVERVHV